MNKAFNYNNKKIQPLDSQIDTKITTDIKIPFSALITGGKGAGKSSLICNLLLKDCYLRKQFNKLYYFSPTASLDRKLQNNITNDITVKNPYLKRPRADLPFGWGQQQQEPEPDRVFFIDTLDPEIFNGIKTVQKSMINKHSKKYSDRILIVIDDFASDKFLHSKPFLNLVLNSRHFNISLIINTQAYFLIDKTLRLNSSLIVLFETGNEKELKTIYDENNCNITFNEWISIYKSIVKEPFQFMTINYQNPPKYRIMENLEYFIKL